MFFGSKTARCLLFREEGAAEDSLHDCGERGGGRDRLVREMLFGDTFLEESLILRHLAV